MQFNQKSTLSQRDKHITQIENELKNIEHRIIKEEQKTSRNLSLLSKLSYVLVSIFTFVLVITGAMNLQSNFDLKTSQADMVYNCNQGETLVGTNCILPSKTTTGNYETKCQTGFTNMDSVCVKLLTICSIAVAPDKGTCNPSTSCSNLPNAVDAESGLCKIDPTKIANFLITDVSDYDGRQCNGQGWNLKKYKQTIVCSNVLNATQKENFRMVNKVIIEVGNYETIGTNSNSCPSGYTPIENGTKCSRPATTTGCDKGGEYLNNSKCEPCPAGKFCPATNGNSNQVPVCSNGGSLSEDKTRCIANNKITYTKYIDGCSAEYIKLDKTCAIKEERTHSLGCTYFYASGNENLKAVESGKLAGFNACSTGGRQDFNDTAIYKVADFNCDGTGTAWYNYNVAFDPLVCGTDLTLGKTQFRWTVQTFAKITPLQKIADGQIRECPTGWLDMGGDSCYQAPIIRQVTTPIDCPINTFAPMGSASCTVCPANTTSVGGSTTAESCKPVVCNNGTVNPPACNICPTGKVMVNNQCVEPAKPEVKIDTRIVYTIDTPKPKVVVEPCVSQAGYFTDSNGFCQICPIGYYCLGKTNSPIICPVGTTTEYQGAKTEIECKSKPVQSTTVIRTIRTGGVSVMATGLIMIVILSYGYYYLFLVNQKGKFSKSWSKVK
jgi:hypothetical protein